MKQKGFTLVELLGVFAFLGIAALVIAPSTVGLLKSSKKDEKLRFENNISLAAEAYIQTNSKFYDGLKQNGGIDYVSFGELIDNGFLSKKYVDPNTKNEIDRNKSVKVTKTADGFTYQIMDKNYSTDGYVNDGLILHYDGYKGTYNDNTDTYIKDISGNNNDGQLFNTTGSIKYKAPGYEFTNNSDYIDSIKNLGLSGDPNFTVETVFKTYGVQNSSHQVIGIAWFGDPIHGGVNGKAVEFNIVPPRLYFTFINNGVAKNITLDTSIHSFVSFKKTGNSSTTTAKTCYDNDCSNNELYGSQTAINIPDSKLQIGRGWQFGGNNRTLNGVIYSVRIYNRVLTQAEITQNYNVDKLRFSM